jgi:hypothetical protein
MPQTPDPKELAALDAIIAYSLAGRNIEDLSDDEILKMAEECPDISFQGREILEKLGPSPFSQRRPCEGLGQANTQRKETAGLYREGSDEGLDPKLKEEIEKKREEIRARLKAKRNLDV